MNATTTVTTLPPIEESMESLQDASRDSDIIRETLRLYGSIYAACLLLFALLRRKLPHLFHVRRKKAKETLADAEYSSFSWFWQVFQVSDIDILSHAGMDALCFLRALRFGRKLALAGCINAIWLLPIYYTAEEAPDTESQVDIFAKLSLSHVPSTSVRFLATVLASYVFFLYTMKLLLSEYHWFATFRHHFLQQERPRNYAVYVSGIPINFRNSTQLGDYFDTITHGQVAEAHVYLDVPKLEKLVAKRKIVVAKLERALYTEEQKQTTLYSHTWRLDRIPTVRRLQNELRDLNHSIRQKVSSIHNLNDPLRSQFNKMQSNLNLLQAIQQNKLDTDHEDAQTILSQRDVDVMTVVSRRERTSTVGSAAAFGSRHTKLGGADDESDSDLDNDTILGRARADTAGIIPEEEDEGSFHQDDLAASETQEASNNSSNSKFHENLRRNVVGGINKAGYAVATTGRVAGTTIARTGRMAGTAVAHAGTAVVKGSREVTTRVIQTAGTTGVETLRIAQTVGTNVLEHAGAVVPILLNKSEGTPRDAGFVVFKSLYATQTALQMVHHPKPYVMEVQAAGDPRDIFWRNVGLPHNSRRSGMIAALTASVVLCFFWSIPMAFVNSLTEISSLKESVPRLGRYMEDHPEWETVFAQIAPLVLLFFNEVILPVALKYFATWEGHISSAMLEASLFLKLGCFMMIQTFFVSAISGGVMSEISNIIDRPERIINLLANSLPAQSSYFIQISLALTFFLQSIEMLRVYPLTVALFRKCLGPRATPKERRQPWGWFHPLSNPPEFWHAETFAQLVLFYLVVFVYNSIAPLTNFFLLLCFVLNESGYRYQFIHNFPRANDTGGRLWQYFIMFTLAGMVVAQLTLIGLLALKQSQFAGPFVLPLLVITVLFIFFLNARHRIVCEYLPTRDCILRDSETAYEDKMDMDFVRGAYLQPSLQDRELHPRIDQNDSDESDSEGDEEGVDLDELSRAV